MSGNTVILCLPNGNKIVVDIPNIVAKEEIPKEDDINFLFNSSETTDNAIDDTQRFSVENIKTECGYLSSIYSPDLSDVDTDSNFVSPLKIEKTEILDTFYDESYKEFSENESFETRDCIPNFNDESNEIGMHNRVSGLIQMLDNESEEESDSCYDETDADKISDCKDKYNKTYKSNMAEINTVSILRSELMKTRSTEVYEGLNKYQIEWTNEDDDKSPENDNGSNMKIVEVRTLVNDTDSSSEGETVYGPDDFEEETDCEADRSLGKLSYPSNLCVDTTAGDIEFANNAVEEPTENNVSVTSHSSLLNMAIIKINVLLGNSQYDKNYFSDESSFEFYLSDSSPLSWEEESQGESCFEYVTNTANKNLDLDYSTNTKIDEMSNRSIETSCVDNTKNKLISSTITNAKVKQKCSVLSEDRAMVSVPTKILPEVTRDLSKQSCENIRKLESVNDNDSSCNISNNSNSVDKTLYECKLMTLAELSMSAMNSALLKSMHTNCNSALDRLSCSPKSTSLAKKSENYSCFDINGKSAFSDKSHETNIDINGDVHGIITEPKAKQPHTLADISLSYINSVIQRETFFTKGNPHAVRREQTCDFIYKPCFSTTVKIKSITGNFSSSKFNPIDDNPECTMVNHKTSSNFNNYSNTMHDDSDSDSSDIRFEIPTIGREKATNNVFTPSAIMRFPLTRINYEDWGLMNPRIRDIQDHDKNLKWADITNMIRNENKNYVEKDENDVEVVSDSERSDDSYKETHVQMRKNKKFRLFRGRYIEIKFKKRRGRKKQMKDQNELQQKLKSRRKRRSLTMKSNTVYRCSSCNYSTKKPSLLKGHQQFHSNKSLQCIYCAYKTTALVNLREHAALFHGTANVYKCENCTYYCSNANEFYLHQGLHKIKIVVPKLVPIKLQTPSLTVDNAFGFKSFSKLAERRNEINLLPPSDDDSTFYDLPEEQTDKSYCKSIQSTPFPFEEGAEIVNTDSKTSIFSTLTKPFSVEGCLDTEAKSIHTSPKMVAGLHKTVHFKKKRRKRRTKKMKVKSICLKESSSKTWSGKKTKSNTSMKITEVDKLIKNLQKPLDFNKKNLYLESQAEPLQILVADDKNIQDKNTKTNTTLSIHSAQQDIRNNEKLETRPPLLNSMATYEKINLGKIIDVSITSSIKVLLPKRNNIDSIKQKMHSDVKSITDGATQLKQNIENISIVKQTMHSDVKSITDGATQLKQKTENISIVKLHGSSNENIKYGCLSCKHDLKDMHSLFTHIAKNHILYKFGVKVLSGYDTLANCMRACKLNHTYLWPVHNHFAHSNEISPPYTLKTLGDGHNESLLVKTMHIGTRENYHSCPRCQLSSKNLKMLVQHILEEHLSVSKLCLVCGIALGDETLLYEHALELHQKYLLPQQTELKSKPARKISCFYCGFTTCSQRSLILHFLLTHPTKLIRCIFCNFLAYSKDNLDAHAVKVHMHVIFPLAMDDPTLTSKFNNDFRRLIKVLSNGSIPIEPFPLLVLILSTVRATAQDRTNRRTLYYKVLDKFCSGNMQVDSSKQLVLNKLKDLFHDPLMAFYCPECSFQSKNDQEFVQHVFKNHGGMSKRQCTNCSYESEKNYYYYWHYWEKHAKSILKCDKCYYWTFKQIFLREHSTRHEVFHNLNQNAFMNFSKIKRKPLFNLLESLSDKFHIKGSLKTGFSYNTCAKSDSGTESIDSEATEDASSSCELFGDDESRPHSSLLDHSYAIPSNNSSNLCSPDKLNAKNLDNRDTIPNDPDAANLVKDICNKEAKVVLKRVITCQLCNFYSFDSMKFLDHILLVHKETPKITWKKLQDKLEEKPDTKMYLNKDTTHSNNGYKMLKQKEQSISAPVTLRNENGTKTSATNEKRSLLRTTGEKNESKRDECVKEDSKKRSNSPELERLMSDLIIALNNDVIIAHDDHDKLTTAPDCSHMKSLEYNGNVAAIVSDDSCYSALKKNIYVSNKYVKANPLHITINEDYLENEQVSQNNPVDFDESVVEILPLECVKNVIYVASNDILNNVSLPNFDPVMRIDQIPRPDFDNRLVLSSIAKPKQNTNVPSVVKEPEEMLDNNHDLGQNHNEIIFVPSEIINDGKITDSQARTQQSKIVKTSFKLIPDPVTENDNIYFKNTSKNQCSNGKPIISSRKSEKPVLFPIDDNSATSKQSVNKHVKISHKSLKEIMTANINENNSGSSKHGSLLKQHIHQKQNPVQPIKYVSHDQLHYNAEASASDFIYKSKRQSTPCAVLDHSVKKNAAEENKSSRYRFSDLNKWIFETDPQRCHKEHSKLTFIPNNIENVSSLGSSRNCSSIKTDKIVKIQNNHNKDQTEKFVISGLNDETIAVLGSKVVPYDDLPDDVEYDHNVQKRQCKPPIQKPYVERTVTPKKSYQIKNKNGEILTELNGKNSASQIRNDSYLFTKNDMGKCSVSKSSSKTDSKKFNNNSSDYLFSRHSETLPGNIDMIKSFEARCPELKVKRSETKKIDLSRQNAEVKSFSSKPISNTIVSGVVKEISIQLPSRTEKIDLTASSTQKIIVNSIQSKYQYQHEVKAKNENLSGCVFVTNTSIDIDTTKTVKPDNINQTKSKLRIAQKCDCCGSFLLKKRLNMNSQTNEYLWCPPCKRFKVRFPETIGSREVRKTLIKNLKSCIETKSYSSIEKKHQHDVPEKLKVLSQRSHITNIAQTQETCSRKNILNLHTTGNSSVKNRKHIESSYSKIENKASKQLNLIPSLNSAPDEKNLIPNFKTSSSNIRIDKNLEIRDCNDDMSKITPETSRVPIETKRDILDIEKKDLSSDCNLQEKSLKSKCDWAQTKYCRTDIAETKDMYIEKSIEKLSTNLAQSSTVIFTNENVNPKIKNGESNSNPIPNPGSMSFENNLIPLTNSEILPLKLDILTSPNIFIDKKLEIERDRCSDDGLLSKSIISKSLDMPIESERENMAMEKNGKATNYSQERSLQSYDLTPLVPKAPKKLKALKKHHCRKFEKSSCENEKKLLIECKEMPFKTEFVVAEELGNEELCERTLLQTEQHNSTLCESNLINGPVEKKSQRTRKRNSKLESNDAKKRKLHYKNKTNSELEKKSNVSSVNIQKPSFKNNTLETGNKSLSNKKVSDLTSAHPKYLTDSSKATNSLVLHNSDGRLEEKDKNNVEPKISSVTRKRSIQVLNPYVHKRKYTRRTTSLEHSKRPLHKGTIVEDKTTQLNGFNLPKSPIKLYCITHVEQLELGLPIIRKVFIKRRHKVDNNFEDTLYTSMVKTNVLLNSKINEMKGTKIKVPSNSIGKRNVLPNSKANKIMSTDAEVLSNNISGNRDRSKKSYHLHIVPNHNERPLIKRSARSLGNERANVSRTTICGKAATTVIEKTDWPLENEQKVEKHSENYERKDANETKKLDKDELLTAGSFVCENKNEAENDFNDSFCEEGLGDVLRDSIQSALITLNNELHLHIDTSNENIDDSDKNKSSISDISTHQSESCMYNLSTEIVESAHSFRNSTELAELLDFG